MLVRKKFETKVSKHSTKKKTSFMTVWNNVCELNVELEMGQNQYCMEGRKASGRAVLQTSSYVGNSNE